MRTERKGPSPRGWPWSVGDSQKDAPELGLKRDEDGETVRMEGAEPNVSASHLANPLGAQVLGKTQRMGSGCSQPGPLHRSE